MSGAFDPYRGWLGIASAGRTPDHYELLGLRRGEGDVAVICTAAERRSACVRPHQSGPHAEFARRLLDEIDEASRCLLSPACKFRYDAGLLGVPAAPAFAPASSLHEAIDAPIASDVVREGVSAAETPVDAAGDATDGRGGDAANDKVLDDAAPVPVPGRWELIRGAFRYLGVQRRRIWLHQTKLQSARWRLGVHVYRHQSLRQALTRLYDRLEVIERKLAWFEAMAAPDGPSQPPLPWWERRLTQAVRRLRVLWIRGRRTAVLRALGQAAYAADCVEAGPTELIEPIRELTEQLASLRDEAGRLACVPPGRWFSPRRLAWLGLALLAATGVLLSGFLRG